MSKYLYRRILTFLFILPIIYLSTAIAEDTICSSLEGKHLGLCQAYVFGAKCMEVEPAATQNACNRISAAFGLSDTGTPYDWFCANKCIQDPQACTPGSCTCTNYPDAPGCLTN